MRMLEGTFPTLNDRIGKSLLHTAKRTAVPTWHAENVEGNEMLVSHEIQDFSLFTPLAYCKQAQEKVKPQLPWAEEHFLERVSGKPLNPPPSAERWQKEGVADKHRTIEEEDELRYSHTYPERFWPKQAGFCNPRWLDCERHPLRGIRFKYGDLGNVVNLLSREPLTRQAFLPVWFPEDTGAAHGERVPCSIGYHFMIRGDQLHMTYMIRSVDFVRHFRDDVYLAMRLAEWVSEKVDVLGLGGLTMHIMSLHYFTGDQHYMKSHYA